jgi:cytochrome c
MAVDSNQCYVNDWTKQLTWLMVTLDQPTGEVSNPCELSSPNFLRSIQVKATTLMSVAAAVAMGFVSFTSAQAAVDADSARALAKGNDCLKCHAIDKDKKGPSLQKISAKYKGKSDGQDKVVQAMTEGKKVKLSDGTQEDHKKIDAKDPKELKNLADWILAQ